MSISDWFKRFLSSPARNDAPAEVASETNEEKTIDEARIDAGGGGPMTADYAGLAANDAAEGALSEQEPPSDE